MEGTPPLYGLADKLYNGVMGIVPDALKSASIAYEAGTAYALGAMGAFALTKVFQLTSKHVMGRWFHKRALPVLEGICAAAVVAIPAGCAVLDPNGLQGVIEAHPVYSSGMLGAGMGGIAGAVNDYLQRKKAGKNAGNPDFG